jgi:Short C-terminal domain
MGIGKKILKTSPVGYAAARAHQRKHDASTAQDGVVDAFPEDELELEDADDESDGDLHKKARRALDENLAPGEEIRVILNMGRRARRAAIIATDRRLFVFKTGAAAGATFGSKFSSFDYRNVGGISLHTGAMTGSAVIDVAGAAPVGSSYWGKRDNDPWKAQNAIPIARPYDRAKEQVAAIRLLVTDWHDRAGLPRGTPVQIETPDVVGQIKRLGELRDTGLLTIEEFEAKKTDLLDRL